MRSQRSAEWAWNGCPLFLMPQKRKKILFVDDDESLLEVLRQIMGHFAGGSWEVLTAPDVSQALGVLQEQRIDLLVIDVHMPLVDGVQFLGLLQRKYPNVLKVVLTGDATEHYRAACLSSGAELFLEKPRDEGGWRSVYATLNELARFQPEEGFRGVLRRVGLQDILQMECLARSSTVLKIHAGSVQGVVYVKEGQIIHAQCGSRSGEEAFNYLMGLTGGEFDIQPFAEPSTQTITGSWEFLLMEAARKRDEDGDSSPRTGHSDSGFEMPDSSPSAFSERPTPALVPVIEAASRDTAGLLREPESGSRSPGSRPRVEEFLVCSLQGEVLHEWQCANTNGRVGFLEFLSQKARQLAQGLPLGDFDRLEVSHSTGRVVAQIQADRALFVRMSSMPAATENPADAASP
jgi:CheY-like chemotaxis protein